MISKSWPAPARAILRTDDGSPRTVRMLKASIAGLALLARHLLAFREAGIRHVTVRVPSAIVPDVRRLARDQSPSDMCVEVQPDGTPPPDAQEPEIEQSLFTLVDPRLVAQLLRIAASTPGVFVCADLPGGEKPDAKSPYRVGVPGTDEAHAIDAEAADGLAPIGLTLRVPVPGAGSDAAAPPSTVLSVGRYYWRQILREEDARAATWMVLLATMKGTDGIYARTNRRVSLRISRALVGTPVTPNMVTIATLGLGVYAGWLLSLGGYAALVAGSMVAWVASMLDGVDGELARARFQASAFGHWLEMVCDYAFYVVLFVGLGEGFRRATGDAIWLVMAGAGAVGVIFSFAAVARLKRGFIRRGREADFNGAYQESVRNSRTHPLMRLTPHLAVFATRAAFPYYLVLFAVLGLAKLVLVLFFLSSQLFWVGALMVSRTVHTRGSTAR